MSAPRRGNGFSRWFGRTMLGLTGWRVEGELPDLHKFVIIVAPHTSNWDFWYGICAMFELGVDAHWIGKHTLFTPPFGGLMRWLGGTPIRRDESGGLVAATARMIRERERFVWTLSPEGTRNRTERWKTGFYHVAHAAGVPIVLGVLDYSRRVVELGPLFETTGDVEADMLAIRGFYRREWARYPERF